jgi:hypothetical protein
VQPAGRFGGSAGNSNRASALFSQGRESVRLTSITGLPFGPIWPLNQGLEHWPYKPRSDVGVGCLPAPGHKPAPDARGMAWRSRPGHSFLL